MMNAQTEQTHRMVAAALDAAGLRRDLYDLTAVEVGETYRITATDAVGVDAAGAEIDLVNESDEEHPDAWFVLVLGERETDGDLTACAAWAHQWLTGAPAVTREDSRA